MSEERSNYELDQQALDADDDGDTSEDTSEGTSSDDGGLSGPDAAAGGAANAGQLGVTPGTGMAGAVDPS